MFTGLIEEIGKVLWIRATERGTQLEIAAPEIARNVRTGQSIGRAVRKHAEPHTVVLRSTVLPGTAEQYLVPALLDGAGVSDVWHDIWPLILMGVIAIPLGLAVFRAGERYAKRHGKLKREG